MRQRVRLDDARDQDRECNADRRGFYRFLIHGGHSTNVLAARGRRAARSYRRRAESETKLLTHTARGSVSETRAPSEH